MKLKFAILFALIVITEIVSAKVFYNWTFINGGLTIANRIFSCFCFFGLLFFGALLLRINRGATLPLAIVFSALFILITVSEIKPTDTETEPVEVATIQTYPDGKKLVIRQYQNIKTNTAIIDTVLVKDVFIFRGLYKKDMSK